MFRVRVGLYIAVKKCVLSLQKKLIFARKKKFIQPSLIFGRKVEPDVTSKNIATAKPNI
jgi:hypothetical protein